MSSCSLNPRSAGVHSSERHSNRVCFRLFLVSVFNHCYSLDPRRKIMRYEAHITVDLRRARDIGEFIGTCKTLGGKALFIELIQLAGQDFGDMKQPFQAMLG